MFAVNHRQDTTFMTKRKAGQRTGISDSNVWNISREGDKEHNAQKPLTLVMRAIENSTVEGAGVLDLFIGSGTTLVACEQTGRIGYGMEIEPKYVAVTLQRMAALGLTPRLVEEV